MGVYVELAFNGTAVKESYTPVTFAVTPGLNYSLIVSNSANLYFNHWTNEDFTSQVLPVTANESSAVYNAIFTTTPQPPPPTPYSITVDSNDLNGTTVGGFKVQVRAEGYVIQSSYTPVTFDDLEPGLQYQVVIYWFGNYYFREFSDGDLNRYALVTFNSTGSTSVSLDGEYQYVPPAEAASLNIIAIFPNGTQLGTTFNNSGYIQHTPGMWLTVTPPGATTPFTGSYTGGSSLPFVLIGGENYTVEMTSSYDNIHFAYWNDTGGTNPVRNIFLNGNVTLVAVYEQGGAPARPAGMDPASSLIVMATLAMGVPPARDSGMSLRSRRKSDGSFGTLGSEATAGVDLLARFSAREASRLSAAHEK